MTPRSLLTTIGATALAFAIAIGIAAGTAADPTPAAEAAAAPRETASTASVARLAWNDPCVIAV